MKDREKRARKVAYAKDIELRQEKKVVAYLDKISKEHYQVEKHQQQYKKVQMRQNLEESLQLKQQIDIEKASNVLATEFSMNAKLLSSGSPAKKMNIDGEAVKRASQNHLDDMFKLWFSRNEWK